MVLLKNILQTYAYELPPELIANKPAHPRDSARLLVYNAASPVTAFDTFKNLEEYLPPNAVLVFNQTKVWPARLPAVKSTGGKVEFLYISHDRHYIKALANKKLALGSSLCFIKGRGKSRPVVVGKKSEQFYLLKPGFPISHVPQVLKKFGITPLPPYIKNSPLTETQKRKEYQSVFAKNGLSVAAPTASLHFTPKLIGKLKKQGIAVQFIRLDVGLGTFAPLRENNIKTGKLHQEFYTIHKSTATFLNAAKKQGRPIIAVGTTVMRTLEAAATKRSSKIREAKQKTGQHLNTQYELSRLAGTTDLFIREGYTFKFVNGLITNFHVPESSLLMLVATFAGRETIFRLYQEAIKRAFRFFSFGDGMLLLPQSVDMSKKKQNLLATNKSL